MIRIEQVEAALSKMGCILAGKPPPNIGTEIWVWVHPDLDGGTGIEVIDGWVTDTAWSFIKQQFAREGLIIED